MPDGRAATGRPVAVSTRRAAESFNNTEKIPRSILQPDPVAAVPGLDAPVDAQVAANLFELYEPGSEAAPLPGDDLRVLDGRALRHAHGHVLSGNVQSAGLSGSELRAAPGHSERDRAGDRKAFQHVTTAYVSGP